MDARLLDIVSCPGCRGEVKYCGDSANRRLTTGAFRCVVRWLKFPVDDGIPVLVQPGTDMDWADWEHEDRVEDLMPVSIARNFKNASYFGLDQGPLLDAFTEAVHGASGPVLDLATGPGGSWCVPVMDPEVAAICSL